MALTSIGDMSQHFMTMRHNTDLKTRLNRLTNELSTGKVGDLTRHLGGDRTRLASFDRGLALLEGFGRAASEASQTLSMMQTVLDQVNTTRGKVAEQLLPVTATSTFEQVTEAAHAGREGFRTVALAMNARLADRALFAGTGTEGAAMGDPDAMLTAIAGAVAASGAVDAAGVVAAVEDWFQQPGGFDTLGYIGATGDPARRRVDQQHTVTLDARADDPAIVNILMASAIAAMAEAPGVALPTDTKSALIRDAGERLLTAGQGIVGVQSRLGTAEARIAEVAQSQTGQRTALTLMRNDMVAADPYDTATALQAVQIQLETHYTLTARLSRLSLTEYLR